MQKGIYRRKPHTETTKRKISESLKGHLCYQNIERNEKIGAAHRGRKLTLDHRAKISSSLIGNTRMLGHFDEQSNGWKGDRVKYNGLHQWVQRRKGKSVMCELCGVSGRMLHWANKSREYKRDLSDWIRLCVPCHSKYDRGLI